MPGHTIHDALEDQQAGAGLLLEEALTVTADRSVSALTFVELGAGGYVFGSGEFSRSSHPKVRGQAHDVTLELELGAVSGTDPELLIIATGSLSGFDGTTHGAFHVTDADANTTKYLTIRTDKPFLGVAFQVKGTTPSFTITKLSVVHKHQDRTPFSAGRSAS